LKGFKIPLSDTPKATQTQQGKSGNPIKDPNCHPESEIPTPRTNPEGKKAQTQKWKV